MCNRIRGEIEVIRVVAGVVVPCTIPGVGTWRSLVAYLNGVQVVVSSNLTVPTISSNTHSRKS